MKQLKGFVNNLVNITMKNNNGYTSMLSGYVTNVGKTYILFLDQDQREWAFKKDRIIDVKQIKKR